MSELGEFVVRVGAVASAGLAVITLTTLVVIRPLRHWLSDEIARMIERHEHDHH